MRESSATWGGLSQTHSLGPAAGHGLAAFPGAQLVDVNLDPPFPNAAADLRTGKPIPVILAGWLVV